MSNEEGGLLTLWCSSLRCNLQHQNPTWASFPVQFIANMVEKEAKVDSSREPPHPRGNPHGNPVQALLWPIPGLTNVTFGEWTSRENSSLYSPSLSLSFSLSHISVPIFQLYIWNKPIFFFKIQTLSFPLFCRFVLVRKMFQIFKSESSSLKHF